MYTPDFMPKYTTYPLSFVTSLLFCLTWDTCDISPNCKGLWPTTGELIEMVQYFLSFNSCKYCSASDHPINCFCEGRRCSWKMQLILVSGSACNRVSTYVEESCTSIFTCVTASTNNLKSWDLWQWVSKTLLRLNSLVCWRLHECRQLFVGTSQDYSSSHLDKEEWIMYD